LGLFQGQIRNAVKDALNSNIPQTIQQEVQQQLNGLDLQIPIGNRSYGIFINFLMKLINFNTAQQYLNLGTAAEFIQKALKPFPQEPISLPDRAANNSRIQVCVSSWTVNTAGYAFFNTDVFKQTIKWTDIPKDFPFQLNTKSFQYLVPNLYAKYPNMNLNIALDAAKPPVCTMDPKNGVEVLAEVYTTFQVVSADNKTTTDAFTLDVSLGLDMVASVVGSQKLTATVSYQNSTLSVKSSNVGDINASVLQTTFKVIVQFGVLPLINAVTQQGFPIISGDFKLVNPSIQILNNYIAVMSDFTFTPTL